MLWFRCRPFAFLLIAWSTVASAQTDVTSPEVLRAVAQKDYTNIVIEFSEALSSGATNVENYQVVRSGVPSDRLPVVAATFSTSQTIVLTTGRRQDRINYELRLTNITDLSLASNNVSSAPIPLKYSIDLLRLDPSITWHFDQSGLGHSSSAWATPAFDDSDWANGGPNFFAWRSGPFLPGPYGTRLNFVDLFDEAQVVTYYFRATFDLPGSSTNELRLRHIIDDGGAVYLNGAPVYSVRLPLPTKYEAFASGVVGTPAYEPTLSNAPLPLSNFAVSGNNLVAVEVHQASTNDNDVAFGLSLEALIDDFAPPLGLTLPTTVTNGSGPLPNIGRVALDQPLTTNLSVNVISSNPSILSLPSVVTVLAGDTNAVFEMVVSADATITGPRRILVRADAEGFAGISTTLTVLDRLPASLALVLPANLVEGSATAQGRLELSTRVPQDLLISLRSSDPGSLTVQPRVVVPAGQTSVVFRIKATNNHNLEGTRNVTVVARVAGWNDGTAIIQVLDHPDSYKIVSLPSCDIAYDPITARIYASIPAGAPNIGSQIAAIDPETAAMESTFFAGSSPGQLVPSPAGARLYAVTDTNRVIRRIDLSSKTTELSFALETNSAPGEYTVEDLAVLPGTPASLAVLRLQYGYFAQIAVYDEGVRRPNVGEADGDYSPEIIEPALDGSAIFFQGWAFQRFANDVHGVNPGVLNPSITGRRDWKAVDTRLFGSDGLVIDPFASRVVATIPNLSGNSLMCYEPAIGRIYYLVPSGANWIVKSYETRSLTFAGSFTVNGISGTPSSLIRWGQNGLAFRTDGNQLFLLRTSLLPTNPPVDVGMTIDLSPAPYLIGSNITQTLQITNGGPNEATEVAWTNTLPPGATVLTALVSSGNVSIEGNVIRGKIGALANHSRVTVTVIFQPNVDGIVTSVASVASAGYDTALANNSVLLPFWVQAPGTSTMSVLNLTSKDLVRDPLRNRLYVSVGNGASLFPNSVVILDLDRGTLAPVEIGFDPGKLACSTDGQFLYVALDNGTVQRLNLGTLAVDLDFPIPNSRRVLEMAVCPTNSDLVAVFRAEDGKVSAYENGVPRPKELSGYVGLLAFSDTTGELYTCHSFYVDTPLHRIDTGPAGLTILDSQPAKPGVLSEMKFRRGILHYNRGTLVEPQTKRVLATLPISFNSVIEPDPEAGRIYVLMAADGPGWALRAFDAEQFIEVGALFITSQAIAPTRLTRWGVDGFAFRTDTQLYLLHSSLVPTNPPTDLVLRTSVSAVSAVPGQALTYTLSVTNLGPNPACGVVLTQAFSLTVTGLTAVAESGIVTNIGSFVTWQLPMLLPGAGHTLSVSVKADQSGTLVTRAAARHSANDPKLNNNFSLLVTRIGSPSSNEIREFMLATRELVFDPQRQLIYASVAAREPFYGNSVVSIDPVTARMEPLLFAGSEPNQLAISDDGRYLYVSLNGTMGARRIDLPGQHSTLDFPFSLVDTLNAFDMKVQPGHPETVAVSRVSTRTSGDYPTDVAMYDNGILRPARAGITKSIEFSPDGQRLYGSITFGAGLGFLRLSVGTQGITVLDVNGSFYDDYDLKLQGDLLYSALGRVIDPAVPSLVAAFGVNGPVAPDAELHRVFQVPLSDTTTELRAYTFGSYQLIGTMPLPGARPYARDLLRCGEDRLAFRTDLGGQVFLLRSALAFEDTDADSMADNWEKEFFNSLATANGGLHDDFDGDGVSNLQEFIEGTDPADPANALHIKAVTFTAGAVEIQFHGVLGHRYQLERATGVEGPWLDVGTARLGKGLGLKMLDTAVGASQFYRVREL